MGGHMKRIMAVALVALFLFSAVLIQPVRAEGLLSDFFDTIKRWFESSPFGNLFSTPIKRMETLTLSFYPEDFEFDITEPVNMSTENTEISNFKGTWGRMCFTSTNGGLMSQNTRSTPSGAKARKSSITLMARFSDKAPRTS